MTNRELAKNFIALAGEQAKALPDSVRDWFDWFGLNYGNLRNVELAIEVIREQCEWIKPSSRVLDWGCGPALPSYVIKFIRPDVSIMGANYHSTDEFPLMWDAIGLEIIRLDHTYNIPLEYDSFDAVIAKGVLEHVSFEQFSLIQLWNILKHDGRLLISHLPCRYSITEWGNRRLGRPNHPRLYTLARAKRLLLSCGFHVVWGGFRHATPEAFPWTAPLAKLAERTPFLRHLTQNISLVGIKSRLGIGDMAYANYNI